MEINLVEKYGTGIYKIPGFKLIKRGLNQKKIGQYYVPHCHQNQIGLVSKIIETFSIQKKDEFSYEGRKDITLGNDQAAAKEAFMQGKSISINAVPGSGKSTLVADICHDLHDDKSTCVLTFSVESKHDLIKKIPPSNHIFPSNFHGLAFSGVQRELKGRVKVDLSGGKFFEFFRKYPWQGNDKYQKLNHNSLKNFAGMIMNGCVDYDDPQALSKLYDHFVNQICFYRFREKLDVSWLLETAPKLMKFMELDAKNKKRITFDEMLYYFVKWNVLCNQYDRLIVDEAQDTNPCQQAMMKKLIHDNSQVMIVGDNLQSIYGFRGADHEAMATMERSFKLKPLPLNETRRIPANISSYINDGYNTKIKSHNGGGEVRHLETLNLNDFEGGQMFLARRRLEVLDGCLKLNCAGIPAYMIGDEMPELLLNTVFKFTKTVNKGPHKKEGEFCPVEISSLLGSGDSENPDDDHITLTKKLLSKSRDLNEYVDLVEEMVIPCNTKVVCGTAHSSKGLENDKVFIYSGENGFNSKMPKQNWEETQERNLKYVAETRAKRSLNWIK